MSHMGYGRLMTVDREQVLRTAAALLTRRATATMDEVARSVGIGRATLHRHFAGRGALIKALEELGLRELEAALDEARLNEGPADEALRRLVACVESSAGLLAFLLAENRLFEGDVYDGWARTDARVSALFRRGQEEGVFRIDLGHTWLTDAFYGLISAAAGTIHDGRGAPRDFSYMIVELLLGGARRSVKP